MISDMIQMGENPQKKIDIFFILKLELYIKEHQMRTTANLKHNAQR